MKFVANFNSTDNHLSNIIDGLNQCQEAFFAVAFLKMSGLNLLSEQIKAFLKKGGHLTIIAGQYFALTEPNALYSFLEIFRDFPMSRLYLSKADVVTSVFHPKLYLFQSVNNCRVISGSANLTKGGLISNKETSLLVDSVQVDRVWKSAKDYFNELIHSNNSDPASLLIIQQYETFYEQQKQVNRKVKPVPTKTKSQMAFNYENLIKHFKKFNNQERQKKFRDKLSNYKEAKKVLDIIVDNPKLTKRQFEPLLDSLVGSKEVEQLWHSGSLYRLRKSVYPSYKEFRDLVYYIKSNKDEPAARVFETATNMVKPIRGAAANYVAEIMMTYNNTDFANLNRNPITVLRGEGGVNLKAHSSSFNGADYEKYCALVKEISIKLGLKNMLEADSFFNEIYWELPK